MSTNPNGLAEPDWDALSAKANAAAAALDRIARQNRQKGDMLDYLLGELNFYAELGADIVYKTKPLGDLPAQTGRRSVRDLVDKYRAAREALYDQ